GPPRLFRAMRTRQRVDEPERAGQERAFPLSLPGVAIQERAGGAELLANRIDRGRGSRVRGVEVAEPHGEQDRGVKLVAVGVKRVAPPRVRPAPLVDPATLPFGSA